MHRLTCYTFTLTIHLCHIIKPLFTLTITVLCCCLAHAEEGILVVQVATTENQPISGVVLSATGDSSTSPPTDVAGKTRIKLAPQTQSGSEIELILVRSPQDLVFISPWNYRVLIPPFKNDAQMTVKVVMAERGKRALLENPQAAVAMVSKINAANARRAATESLTEEQRQANLVEVAKSFGFNPEEVDRVIRALGKRATDSYQLGLVALYEKDYPEATRRLAAAVTERKLKLEQSKSELADAYRFMGQALYEQGLFNESARALQEAVNLRDDDEGILNSFGIALLGAGEYVKAEMNLQRRLEIIKQAPQIDELTLAQSFNNLAMVYQAEGRYSEAESLLKKASEIWEKYLGPKHREVARGFNNLAMVYEVEGRYAEAEMLFKRVVEIWEKWLEPEHPDLALVFNNLAMTYQDQGRYAEAEPLHKSALAIWEKKLGPEHPNVALGLNNLGNLYLAQGKYSEAEPLHNHALTIWKKRLGPEHPNVALCLNSIAMVYQSQGKLVEAESLLKEALGISEKKLGPEHPSVAICRNNLGRLYQSQGKLAEAESLFKEAIRIWEKKFGPEHTIAVLTCMRVSNHSA